MTRVDVIVNNHNYEPFLGAAVDSALAQSWPVEVIVVDDGSTDRSRSIIDGYGRAVRSIYQPKRGQSAALNAAFAEAKGDWILFLDADDVMDREAIERAAGQITATTVKVHWPLRTIDADGRSLARLQPTRPLSRGQLREAMLAEGPEAHVYAPTSGNLFRASFLRRVFPIPEVEPLLGVGSASADYLLSCIATLYGPVSAVEEPLGSRRLHGSNDFATADFARRLRHNLWAFDHVCRGVAEHAVRLGLKASSRAWKDGAWIHAVKRVVDTIAESVPEGEALLLIDDDEWGLPPTIEGRRCHRLIEVGDQNWGPPESDEQAVSALDELRGRGVRFLIHGMQARWWMTAYPRFADLLAEYWRPVRQDRAFTLYETIDVLPRRRTGDSTPGAGHSTTDASSLVRRLVHQSRPPVTPANPCAALIARIAERYASTLADVIPSGTRCAIVDAPDHANVGDSAIWLGERLALQRLGVDVAYACTLKSYDPSALADAVADGPILIHGGGNLGDLWPTHQEFREDLLKRFDANPIIQLSQTANFRWPSTVAHAREAFEQHPNFTILARDEASVALLRRLFRLRVVLCPDAAFSMGPLVRPVAPQADVLWLARTDLESAGPGAVRQMGAALMTDWLADDDTMPDAGACCAALGLEAPVRTGATGIADLDAAAIRRLFRGSATLSLGRNVLTDRLHGHILALLLGIPHTLVDDAFGKVRGFAMTWTVPNRLTSIRAATSEEAMAIAERASLS